MRKIIVLEKQNNPNERVYNYIFWLSVPAGRELFYANADAVSAYKNATPDEVNALKYGTVLEIGGQAVFSKTDTTLEIKNWMMTKYQQEQALLDARTDWNLYGSSWDGTAWDITGVA